MKKDLSKQLHNIDAIKFGEFTLKSGKKSSYYLDLRTIISYPKLLGDITTIILDKIPSTIQRVCGVPYAALPLATSVSLQTNLPQLIKRKEAKGYGTKKLIEGEFNSNDEILLLEDVITSGISLIETITELENEGLKIGKIITIVDREEGGMDKIKSMGYNIESILTITELLNYTNELLDHTNKKIFPTKHNHTKGQRLLDIAIKKQSNIIASIDLIKSNDILKLLDNIGHLICGVKIHVDIIEDFTWDFINELKELSYWKEFMIIEDRKFADIGNTQIMQISGGIYRISDWADFITCHLIGGESTFKAYEKWETYRKPALIPILEMSSEGALTGVEYIEAGKNFLNEYSDIIGVVSQKSDIGNGLLKFTPGINLKDKGDNKGQQYNTPEFAISELGSDFLIIGRGLYQSEDPVGELEKYLISIRETGLFD
jgi:uridine monophosphate synthetase